MDKEKIMETVIELAKLGIQQDPQFRPDRPEASSLVTYMKIIKQGLMEAGIGLPPDEGE